MRTKKPLPSLLLAAALLLTTSATAWADPPARVGRIGYLQGEVAFHNAEQSQWTSAMFNYPVTTGDAFWTDQGARTEIQVGASEIRMDQATELDITRLDDEAMQLNVPQGTINIHLHTPPATPVQVITPQGEIDLLQPGSYHIEASHPGAMPSASVTVLEGSAQIQGPSSPLSISAGEHATLSGSPASVTLDEAIPTAFDNWALTREHREVELGTAHYVSAETTGINDLNNYGQWASTPSYGAVWYPSAVPAGWAPYRYGHWAYVAPWGWTWIDDAPWGFAPFHYGRWAHIHGRWGWCPGEREAHPVYAPALVTFVGDRSSVGWVPLAPHEAFRPYYHTSMNYIRNVNANNVDKTTINRITVNNVTNNVNINQYANSKVITMVPHSAFAKGAPVHHTSLPIQPSQITKANITTDVDRITPSRESRHEHFRNIPPAHHETQAHIPTSVPIAMPHREHEHKANEHEIARPTPPAAPQHPIPPLVKEPQMIRHDMPENHIPKPIAQPRPMEITHPVQHFQIEPTPQGWQRVPHEQHGPSQEQHGAGHPVEQHPHAQEQPHRAEPHSAAPRDTNDNRGHP
ncbi:MAG TPA: DUF6600 domain-containing protein [Rickettsiales bacterium]|nr:DUF6600 domain-containing protein [Rickettsiales bacterium]